MGCSDYGKFLNLIAYFLSLSRIRSMEISSTGKFLISDKMAFNICGKISVKIFV